MLIINYSRTGAGFVNKTRIKLIYRYHNSISLHYDVVITAQLRQRSCHNIKEITVGRAKDNAFSSRLVEGLNSGGSDICHTVGRRGKRQDGNLTDLKCNIKTLFPDHDSGQERNNLRKKGRFDWITPESKREKLPLDYLISLPKNVVLKGVIEEARNNNPDTECSKPRGACGAHALQNVPQNALQNDHQNILQNSCEVSASELSDFVSIVTLPLVVYEYCLTVRNPDVLKISGF
ncbi:hypothetical protein J6590_003634 [Homalodisca vitripennis]|nr:hypothetical protein J6590_003634 [Homalodisca vitripennis]